MKHLLPALFAVLCFVSSSPKLSDEFKLSASATFTAAATLSKHPATAANSGTANTIPVPLPMNRAHDPVTLHITVPDGITVIPPEGWSPTTCQ